MPKFSFRRLHEQFKGLIARKKRTLTMNILELLNEGKTRLLALQNAHHNLIAGTKKTKHVKVHIDIRETETHQEKITRLLKTTVWQNIDNFSVAPLHGGTTNALYKCTRRVEEVSEDGIIDDAPLNDSPQVVLVRIYGTNTEDIIDRDYELQLLKALERQSIKPKLYATFENGYVFEYLHGRAVTAAELRTNHISKLVAKRCAKWHQVDLPGKRKPALWNRMESWLQLARSGTEALPPGYTWDWITSEIDLLKTFLDSLNSPVVSCHNDLTAGNIIYDDEKDSVCFIDFEYSGYNYRGFDLGNYFCEWAGLELNFAKFPTKDQRLAFLRHYLEACGVDQSNLAEELDSLYLEASAFALASHLLWGLWALVQMQRSSIDFDYMAYATKRFDEYYKRKAEFKFAEEPLL
jgi:ethanolamine kinase